MRSDISLIFVGRGVRGIGDGFAVIVLPAYLSAAGYDTVVIGAILTAALLGTAALTLTVGAIATRYDLRTLMLAGATLMAVTFAFGTTAPVASTTVPTIRPVASCARAEVSRHNETSSALRALRMMYPLSSAGWQLRC